MERCLRSGWDARQAGGGNLGFGFPGLLVIESAAIASLDIVPPKGARLAHKTVFIGTYVFVIIAEDIPRAGLC